MARYYALTTKELFLQKIEKIMLSSDEDADDEYPYNMPAAIQKDLAKVSFDFENFSDYNDQRNDIPDGYREIAPGFHIFFAWAGGDWEYPVTWVFYNSDKGIRAYIPSNGNPWNKREKAALGNNDDDDLNNTYADEAAMIADIMNRIKLKL